MVEHPNFASFSAYLAETSRELQQRFEAGTLKYVGFAAWQYFLRCFKGKETTSPRAPVAAGTDSDLGGRSFGRPPLVPAPPGPSDTAVLRKRTLDNVLGITACARASLRARKSRQEGGHMEGSL